MTYHSEIFLTKKDVSSTEWAEFIKYISKYNGFLKKWSIIISIEGQEIRYYLTTNFKVPVSINNLSSFIIKQENIPVIKADYLSLPIYFPIGSNTIECLNYSQIKRLGKLKYIHLKFFKLTEDKFISKTYLYHENNKKIIKSKMVLGIPNKLLSISFSENNIYSPKSIPKYFDITKLIPYLSSQKNSSSLEIEPFPYLDGQYYLTKTDFNKHSLILGSSGTGKSKYLSSFIYNLYQNYPDKYRIIMIDPHASIENDIGSISKIIDFNSIEDSLNIFASHKEADIISETELTLELFKGLITQYNSKLERVLRHSIYLLLTNQNFSFNSLRQLLLDSEYRMNIINQNNEKITSSTIDFFLTDFNDLKTKSYGEAISPIISFIDEMEMLPVLNQENIPYNLEDTIKNNFLTLFSLDKTKIGEKALKTISGFIMQQLFTIAEKHLYQEHLIFIIDEVAVVENPILSRFLSEARKYNLSLILVSQYFNQISNNLKEAIFANVINYYLFRLSRNDANTIVDNLDFKIPLYNSKSLAEQREGKINMLSSLNNRECVTRISIEDKLIPAFKAKTTEFKSLPRYKKNKLKLEIPPKINKTNNPITFNLDDIDIHNILSANSTSRMVIK